MKWSGHVSCHLWHCRSFHSWSNFRSVTFYLSETKMAWHEMWLSQEKIALCHWAKNIKGNFGALTLAPSSTYGAATFVNLECAQICWSAHAWPSGPSRALWHICAHEGRGVSAHVQRFGIFIQAPEALGHICTCTESWCSLNGCLS